MPGLVRARDRDLWILLGVKLEISVGFAEPRRCPEVRSELVDEHGAVRVRRDVDAEVQ